MSDSSNIDIFLRIKPVQRPSQKLSWDPNEGLIQFNMPRDVSQGYVNNQRENYEFRFNGILTPDAKQDEVGATPGWGWARTLAMRSVAERLPTAARWAGWRDQSGAAGAGQRSGPRDRGGPSRAGV